jgi:hypothetical protein
MKHPTSELTGRGDYIQPSIRPIKLRNTLPALRSNDLLCPAAQDRFDTGKATLQE